MMNSVIKSAVIGIFLPFDQATLGATAHYSWREIAYAPEVVAFRKAQDYSAINAEFTRRAKELGLQYYGFFEFETCLDGIVVSSKLGYADGLQDGG